jgi:hypothetical protein
MRFIVIPALILLSAPAFAQEENAGAWTASTSPTQESCGADIKLDLDRWKDFAETLSPSRRRPVIGH